MNITSRARTNAFRVKDTEKFAEAMAAHEVRVVEYGGNLVALIAETDTGMWPHTRHAEETDEEFEIDWPATLSEHLARDSIAVVMEIGGEGLRSIYGEAWAVKDGTPAVVCRVSLMDEMRRVLNALFGSDIAPDKATFFGP